MVPSENVKLWLSYFKVFAEARRLHSVWMWVPCVFHSSGCLWKAVTLSSEGSFKSVLMLHCCGTGKLYCSCRHLGGEEEWWLFCFVLFFRSHPYLRYVSLMKIWICILPIFQTVFLLQSLPWCAECHIDFVTFLLSILDVWQCRSEFIRLTALWSSSSKRATQRSSISLISSNNGLLVHSWFSYDFNGIAFSISFVCVEKAWSQNFCSQ